MNFKSKCRVLYISANGYLGGAERFVYNALAAHKNRGRIQADLYTFHEGELVDRIKALGIKSYVSKSNLRLSKPTTIMRACLELRDFLKKGNYTHVHSTMPYAHLITSIATISLPTKKIWFQHGPVWGKLDFLCLPFPVDLIYLNSVYTEKKHLTMPFSSIHKEKHRVINLGIPSIEVQNESAHKIREKYLSKNENTLLLSAARITSWKGQHLLIEAINHLKKNNSMLLSGVKILIAGTAQRNSDKVYEDRLKELVVDSGLKEKIIFIGHQQQISNFYKASDIFIHTSTTPEPFGLAVAEAMMTETLVIGPNRGGITDILHDNKTGLTFDSLDENASSELHLKIIEALTSKHISVKKEAKHLIESKYSMNSMMNILEDDLDSL